MTPDPSKINPASLSAEELAKLLSAAGGKLVTVQQVEEDISAGAPVNGDGRINLVHYVAWLSREIQNR